MAALLQSQSLGAEHESARKLLGQCRGRVLLQQLEERTHQETNLCGSKKCVARRDRIHRRLLQSKTTAQLSGWRQSERVRSGAPTASIRCPLNPGNSTTVGRLTLAGGLQLRG